MIFSSSPQYGGCQRFSSAPKEIAIRTPALLTVQAHIHAAGEQPVAVHLVLLATGFDFSLHREDFL